jgi:hypothetical protein
MREILVHPKLARALALSHEMLEAAEQSNLPSLSSLDAERLQLLKSFRLETKRVDAADRVLLQQIAQLNDRAIGLLEHLKRGKGRELDMAAIGRRAVAAYSGNRQQRQP